MNRSHVDDLTDAARRALEDSVALAPTVPPELVRTVERRGRRANATRATLGLCAALAVSASTATLVTGADGPPSSPSVAAPGGAGLPVVFAPVTEVRPKQETCPAGWLPDEDLCYRLAGDQLRVDQPRGIRLVTDRRVGVTVVRLTLRDGDADRLRDMTSQLAQRQGQLGAVVDGRVVWAPLVRQAVTGPSIDIGPTDGDAQGLFDEIR